MKAELPVAKSSSYKSLWNQWSISTICVCIYCFFFSNFVCVHECFHQIPFASAVNLTDKLVAPSLQQYPPINQPLKQEIPCLNPPLNVQPSECALSSPPSGASCIPRIMGAVPTSCQHSDKETHRLGAGTSQEQGWVISSGSYCLREREVMTGVSVPLCVYMCVRLLSFWGMWLKNGGGMEGVCLSLCLHMINRSTWNPFTVVESRQ